ncbi:Short-chain dehydrogenase/reductase tropE like protein [Verticillium longisporum]|uniref:Short-chain dehydrogenase/reductase tropE like protein n=1 Tax=Verticillium longisporum TaxID=100787 RepID=A0A8I2Z3J1_VERLO|nr:Short-chain dehydrogenase/reductase tropE like protein [Verticillium longisporum]
MSTQQKIVLITGANTGLGLELVRSLLQTGTPYSIIIGSRSLDNATKAITQLTSEFPSTSSTLHSVQIDVEDDASIEKAAAWVQDKFGKLDTLVNNAGTQLDQQISLGKLSVREAWNKTWDVNTTGAHIVTMTFVPLLLSSDDPRIIFIASGTSTLTGSENLAMPSNQPPAKGWPKATNLMFDLPAYRCSKTGMNMLMREWHRTLGSDGVKVWCVSPGFLATGLGGYSDSKKGHGALDPSVGATLIRKVVEGEKDTDAGKIISLQGIQPW